MRVECHEHGHQTKRFGLGEDVLNKGPVPQVDSIEIADCDECSRCRDIEVLVASSNRLLRHASGIYYVTIDLPSDALPSTKGARPPFFACGMCQPGCS